MIASVIFFGVLAVTLSARVDERLHDDIALLRLPLPERSMDSDAWWQGEWSSLPGQRTRFKSVAARDFTFQLTGDLAAVAEKLEARGWESVPGADWTWIVQALNPAPDAGSLPLLGKDYLGHKEVLLLRRAGSDASRQLTLRIWDSGIRLQPAGQTLYLGQVSEEMLVQRLHLLSYWRALPAMSAVPQSLFSSLAGFESRTVGGGLMLIRSDAAKGR